MKTEEIQIKLNIKPLSVNQLYQGRRYLTEKGKKFKEDCFNLIPKQRQIKGLVKVSIIVYLKKAWLKNDSDNFLKPILDVIQSKGLIEDDRFITSLSIEKRRSIKDFIIIKIEKV